jgi:hypothetical protein
LARFGLHVPPMRNGRGDEVTKGELLENLETFGYQNPIEALVEQKWLKSFSESGPDGQPEEFCMMADTGASAEMTQAECASNINDLMAT